MRKVPPEYENPIDNLLVDIWEPFTGIFHKLGFTPNMLTTISLAFGISSSFLLYNDYKILSLITFVLAYFFDCADGYYARKYDMVTEFGDYYDHFSDWFKVALIIFVVYIKQPHKLFKILLVMFLFFIPLSVQIGCQEKYYEINGSPVEQPIIGKFKYLCKGEPTEQMKIFRYFGFGTYMLILTLLIFCNY